MKPITIEHSDQNLDGANHDSQQEHSLVGIEAGIGIKESERAENHEGDGVRWAVD